MMSPPRLFLGLFCALLLTAPAAHAQPAPQREEVQTCESACPEGTVPILVMNETPEFADCTEAYTFYIMLDYEYIVKHLAQGAVRFGDEYIAACRQYDPQTMQSAPHTVTQNQRLAAREAAAIPAVMRHLVKNQIAAIRVPPHCRTNAPAQDEAIALFDTWLAETRAYTEKLARRNIRQHHARMDCQHLISDKKAHIFAIDFKDDILLGLAAGYTTLIEDHPPELADSFRNYKAARDAIDTPAQE